MRYKSLSIFVVLLIVGILSGCQEQQVTQEFAGVHVTTYTVGQQPISKQERFYGEIISKEAVRMSSTIPGRIQKAPQTNGEEVNKGQTLFRIENTDLQSSVSQAKSAIGVAQANLEKIKTGSREQEILAMEENVQAAKVGYESASLNAERFTALLESGAISQQQMDQAQTELQVAESKYNSLQHQLEQMKEGPEQENIQVGEAQLQQAQVTYNTALAKVKDLSIASPLSGLITDIQVEEGEFVNPGMPLATIHNIEQVYVQVQIPESIYLSLKQGEQVQVNIPSVNHTYSGSMMELNPHADPRSKLFSVKILINNEKKLLKPGMTAEAHIPIVNKSKALIIPVDTIINDKGQSVVYIIEDQLAKKRNIQTGIRTNTNIEVLSGLQLGEQIIGDGVEFVRDGDQVQVVEEGSE